MYILRETKTEVIRGKLDGQDYVVQEAHESAKKMTYQQWHKALGHPSPEYLKATTTLRLPASPKF